MFHNRKSKNNPACAVLLAAVVFFSGCAATPPPQAPLATAASSDAVYTLNILEEVNDGKRLYVTAEVALQEPLGETHALLRLKALANGATIGEAFSPLTAQNLDSEKSNHHLIRISADAESLTDYQMDLLWGKEADSYINALPMDKTVGITNVALMSSGAGKKPKITGKFENRGVSPITKLAVLVQFVWVPDGEKLDLSSLKPENDTEAEVPGISIPPGASRDFSIEIETEIPPTKGGVYTPVVRIKDGPREQQPSTDSPKKGDAG